MGGFIVASSLSPEASQDKSDDGFGSADDAEDDDDDGLPGDDEMSTRCTCTLSLVTKRESSFEMRVVILVGEGLVQEIEGVFI